MTVHLDIADHVARVTIDRPEVLNALDAVCESALEEIWRTLEGDPKVRAVVLTGAGDRAFCTGPYMRNVGKSGLAYWSDGFPNGFGGIALRSTLDIRVIARVNGHALGGGF
jgi:crotonobetainyl-CoA hydratase